MDADGSADTAEELAEERTWASGSNLEKRKVIQYLLRIHSDSSALPGSLLAARDSVITETYSSSHAGLCI